MLISGDLVEDGLCLSNGSPLLTDWREITRSGHESTHFRSES